MIVWYAPQSSKDTQVLCAGQIGIKPGDSIRLPIRGSNFFSFPCKDFPQILTSPEVGFVKPNSIFMVVVFRLRFCPADRKFSHASHGYLSQPHSFVSHIASSDFCFNDVICIHIQNLLFCKVFYHANLALTLPQPCINLAI